MKFYAFIMDKKYGSIVDVYKDDKPYDETVTVVPLEDSPPYLKNRKDLFYFFCPISEEEKNYFLDFIKNNFDENFNRFTITSV